MSYQGVRTFSIRIPRFPAALAPTRAGQSVRCPSPVSVLAGWSAETAGTEAGCTPTEFTARLPVSLRLIFPVSRTATQIAYRAISGREGRGGRGGGEGGGGLVGVGGRRLVGNIVSVIEVSH